MARKKRDRSKPPTSPELNSFREELAYAGNPKEWEERIARIRRLLETVIVDEQDWGFIELTGRAAKKNYAQWLSEAIAQKTADALRSDFPEIVPDASGKGHESRSAGAGGLLKLDVNYSTAQRGLALAISIKTVNFADAKSKRYTKNMRRFDKELRAEAQECHRRHPYAVLVAYIYLPVEAATDGVLHSSLSHAAKILGDRTGRKSETHERSRFELAFLGVYEEDGHVRFFTPETIPGKGLPAESMSFGDTLAEVRAAYKLRNRR